MEKFIYMYSLEDIKRQLATIEEYPLYHLVDEVHLLCVGVRGDFMSVIDEHKQKQTFSLSHMYQKRAIKPDNHLFKATFIGPHDDTPKHELGVKINDFSQLETVLKSYGFDGFYMLLSLDELLLNLNRKKFLAAIYRQDPAVDMTRLFQQKSQTQDGVIHFKDNISNFVRLHYRPKDDMLIAFAQAFKRQGKPSVLVRLRFDLISDGKNRVYPLSNCGLDLMYDQHFYQLNLTAKTVPLYHFEKYDFVAQFSSYDNHRHSTMVRTAEVLVFDQLSTRYIDAIIFASKSDQESYLSRVEHPEHIALIVDEDAFI